MVYQDLIKAKQDGKLNDEVGDIFIRAMRAKDFHSRRFNRSLENWRYYLGLDSEYGLGQWNMKMVAYMAAQSRQLSTYNFSKVYVDQIAGGIMQAPFDPEFYPVNDEITSLTEMAKNAMYSDKELCDWNSSYFELVRAGLIHQGVLKPVIIDKYHKLGNIGFEMVLPNMWYGNPMWVTMHTKDCKICWEEIMVMHDDLLETYGNRVNNLEGLLSAYRNRQKEYGVPNGPTPFAGSENSWGSALRLINEYQMMKQNVLREIYHGPDGDVQIPSELPDAKAKIDWLNQTLGQDAWDPYSIEETKEKEDVCIKRVICPSISWAELLDKRPSEIQIGQIPFYVWSADRVNGEPHGIIDMVKTAQDDINYTASMATFKMQCEGGGGAQFVDEEGFESPEECELYIKNRNDPTKSFKTAPGLLVRTGQVPAKPAIISQFSAETYNRINHIFNVMLPNISKVVPAYRGQTDQQNTSGYLFNLQKIQAEQALYTIHYTLRQFWNQVYEGYLMQAGYQYSIEGVPRRFSFNKGKESGMFNEPITMPDGSKGIRNDAGMLRQMRHKIIISEVQQTPTKKSEDLNILNDYLRSLGPVAAQKPATLSFITSRMAELIEPLSSDDREILKKIGSEETELALARLEVERRKIEMELNPPPAPAVPPQAMSAAYQGSAPGQQAPANAQAALSIPQSGPQA